MKIIWDDEAWEEYVEQQTIDRKIVKKINELIKDIQKNGEMKEQESLNLYNMN